MAKSKSLAVTILCVTLVIALVGGICFAVYWFGYRLNSGDKTFGVNIGDDLIKNDDKKREIKSGTQFSLSADGDYAVTIYSNPDITDFSFKIGVETYSWKNDCADRDYTRGFDITKNADGFTLVYNNLSGVIEKANGFSAGMIVFDDIKPPYGYMFDMRITTATAGRRILFALEGLAPADLDGLEIDKDGIIF